MGKLSICSLTHTFNKDGNRNIYSYWIGCMEGRPYPYKRFY
jgi:hypothetical protein